MTDAEADADAAGLIEVGRVVKPHGLRGEVVVQLLTDRPEVRFEVGATLDLDGRASTVVTSRPHQGRWLVRLTGVDGRDGAERLRGAVLRGPVLPGDDDTETFWVHELVGTPVLTEDGEPLGVVSSVVELPPAAGYDLLEVEQADGATWFLPAADDLVEATATDDGGIALVVIDPPAGLWEPDEQVALQPGQEVERRLAPPTPGSKGED